MGLAERLRIETRPLHAAVERAGIMPALLRGELNRTVYCRLLRNLLPIYRGLEGALRRNAALPPLRPFAVPILPRAAALAADLYTLHGAGWARELRPVSTTREYLRRLREIERGQPALLAAHAYVRYLGDLSGGRILARIVGARFGLSGVEGRRFYDFGDAAAGDALAASLRRGLDLLTDEPLAAELVAEAKRSFRLHARLFEELAG